MQEIVVRILGSQFLHGVHEAEAAGDDNGAALVHQVDGGRLDGFFVFSDFLDEEGLDCSVEMGFQSLAGLVVGLGKAAVIGAADVDESYVGDFFIAAAVAAGRESKDHQERQQERNNLFHVSLFLLDHKVCCDNNYKIHYSSPIPNIKFFGKKNGFAGRIFLSSSEYNEH